MAYCKFCGGSGKWRTLPAGRKRFFHARTHDCAAYIAHNLSAKRRKLCLHTFTRPTRCGVCGGDCFYYQNEHGSKVFFDELGPPWPKHDHAACIRRQEKRPKPPYRWELAGYEPCVIFKAFSSVPFQMLVVYVRGLKSERKLALRVSARDIKSFIARMHQPFLLKELGERHWELNTYAQFYDLFEPRAYECSLAQFAWPAPPEPPDAWF